jgi:hypothetical protein
MLREVGLAEEDDGDEPPPQDDTSPPVTKRDDATAVSFKNFLLLIGCRVII